MSSCDVPRPTSHDVAACPSRWLPYGVLGIVMAFAAADPRQARDLALTSRAWKMAYDHSVDLWEALACARWPQLGRRRSLPRSAASYRALWEAQRRLWPIPPSVLHPIEHCDFSFRCPQLANVLEQLPTEFDAGGRAILFCHVCRERVYTVESQEELNACARVGRCVRFPRAAVAPAAVLQSCARVHATVHCVDESIGTTFLASLRQQAPFRGRVCSTTIPMGTEMWVRFPNAVVFLRVVAVNAIATPSCTGEHASVGHVIFLKDCFVAQQELDRGSSRDGTTAPAGRVVVRLQEPGTVVHRYHIDDDTAALQARRDACASVASQMLERFELSYGLKEAAFLGKVVRPRK